MSNNNQQRGEGYDHVAPEYKNEYEEKKKIKKST